MTWVWVVSIIATLYLAEQKSLGVGGFLVLSIFTWLLAVIIARLLPARDVHPTDSMQGVNNLRDAKRQLQDIRHSLGLLQNTV